MNLAKTGSILKRTLLVLRYVGYSKVHSGFLQGFGGLFQPGSQGTVVPYTWCHSQTWDSKPTALDKEDSMEEMCFLTCL